jgi:hypothetical protein
MLYDKYVRDPSWLKAIDVEQFRTFFKTLKLKNPYHEDYWHKYFPTTDLYKHIKSKLAPTTKEIWTSSGQPGNTPTPRENQLNSYWTFNTFYYIEDLLKFDGPIYDLGCGGNLLKPFVDNIIGIDPFHPDADIGDICDEGFVAGHQNYFDRLIAINSLHFCALDKFSSTVDDFYSMLKPGGVGYVTFSLANMVALTSDSGWNTIFNKHPDQTNLIDVVTYLESCIQAMPYNFHIVDQNYFVQRDYGQLIIGNEVDGNIRLVVQR